MVKEEETKKTEAEKDTGLIGVPPKLIGMIADEVAKTLAARLPQFPRVAKRKAPKAVRKLENPILLDTSAIIDGRIFEVLRMGLMNGVFVVLEGILLELKHIADSQDSVKRERGRNGLEFLDKLKKTKNIKVTTLSEEETQRITKKEIKEVDERLIAVAKKLKGRIITCDYNLEKKANIQGIQAINVNALAMSLKVRAVPGESLHVSLIHVGKDPTQGVGYLDDGTMIVVQNGSTDIGKTIDVVIARIIQTAAGRILFAKKI